MLFSLSSILYDICQAMLHNHWAKLKLIDFLVAILETILNILIFTTCQMTDMLQFYTY